MTTLETIEQLKQQRKAEIAARDQEVERKRQELVRAGQMAFQNDLSRALAQLDADWLLPFQANPGVLYDWTDDDTGRRMRRVQFTVPGHRSVYLMLSRPEGHFDWILPDRELFSHIWSGTNNHRGDEYVETLIDALIVSEIDSNEPEIPF